MKLISAPECDLLNYFPIKSGLKAPSIGLKKLPSYDDDRKNRVFHIDEYFQVFRESKEVCRLESLSKYYQNQNKYNIGPICKYIMETLVKEYPSTFSLNGQIFHSALTNETIEFNQSYELISQKTNLQVKFVDLFDALSMQVPEDLVIHNLVGDKDFTSVIHLCHANGWSAEGFVGNSFFKTHEEVPGAQKMFPRPEVMVRGIINSDQVLERVAAISFRTNTFLNRHPDVVTTVPNLPFDLNDPKLFIRFERQTVTGFKDLSSFLFTIRTYFIDCNKKFTDLEKHNRIVEVFEQNNPNVNAAKFISSNRDNVLTWLNR